MEARPARLPASRLRALFLAAFILFTLGTVREALAAPLKVSGRFLQDAHGNDLLLRGVNVPVYHSGFIDDVDAVAAAVALTQANAVRLEWWAVPPGGTTEYTNANFDRAIQKYFDLGMIPIVELHDLTFQSDPVAFANTITPFWTDPAIVAILQKHQDHVVVNLANEWGDPGDAATFLSTYGTAIAAIRAAGIIAPLMIDAPQAIHYEFFLAHGAEILALDPQHNTLLSVHAYWAASDANYSDANVDAILDSLATSGLPIVLGEVSSNAFTNIPCDPIHYSNLLAHANTDSIGYLFWAWYEDGQCGQDMNITVNQDGVTLPDALHPGFGFDALDDANFGIDAAQPPTARADFSGIAPAITSVASASFVVRTAGTFTATATGTPAPSFSISPLPSGLLLDAATGVISGTPASGTVGVYPLTLTASNGVLPDATQSFTLTVAKAGQAISFANPGPQSLAAPSVALSASSSSGLAVALTSSTPSVCTVAGSVATLLAAGTCTIDADQAGDADFNAAPQVAQSFTVSAGDPPRLGNISTRMEVLTGNDVMIAGFIIGGSSSKTVAIVATGPSLVPFGIANPLANPTLTLVRQSDHAVIATNDNWQADANASLLQSSGFAPTNPLEAGLYVTLAPGAYTAIVSGANGGTGVSVAGVFEIDHPEIPLVNISTRGEVLTGNDVMIAGLIVQGSAPQKVAITATGPSLVPFGITNPLANPTLTLVRQSDHAVIATNDDWQTDPNASQLQASGFAPTNPLESGLVVTLPPGAYTAIVSGAGNTTGVSVVGVFTVP